MTLLLVADRMRSWAPDRGSGTSPAVPRHLSGGSILLKLAAELALKALIMCSTGSSLKGHDLFNRIPEDMRRQVERRMPPIPGRPDVHPPVGVCEAFEVSRSLFIERRHLHKRLNAGAETGAK